MIETAVWLLAAAAGNPQMTSIAPVPRCQTISRGKTKYLPTARNAVYRAPTAARITGLALVMVDSFSEMSTSTLA